MGLDKVKVGQCNSVYGTEQECSSQAVGPFIQDLSSIQMVTVVFGHGFTSTNFLKGLPLL